jgi:hypothetical protein
VSRQATFALFDACAIKRGWVMVRQRVQGEALAYPGSTDQIIELGG